ncbi:MAG: alanine racemase [Thermoleophilia bacterium]
MPRLTIDLTKIEHNARLVVSLLEPFSVRLVGVTKACLGNERVAGAMLAGGATALADSRVRSISNLRRHLPDAELHLMRSPVDDKHLSPDADLYYVSSVTQAEALLNLWPATAGPLPLCLMVDTGDGREGVPVEQAAAEAVRLSRLAGVKLIGLATNAACARPRAPMAAVPPAFSRARAAVARELKTVDPPAAAALNVFSAGGSGLLGLLPEATPPGEDGTADGTDSDGDAATPFAGITNLRCGEALLLGRIPSGSSPGLFLPDAQRDAFVLEAPALQVREKNGGRQALLGFGVQDVGHAPLVPLRPEVSLSRITSDYSMVDIRAGKDPEPPVRVGDRLAFVPAYYSLLAAMTSPFVEKVFV